MSLKIHSISSVYSKFEQPDLEQRSLKCLTFLLEAQGAKRADALIASQDPAKSSTNWATEVRKDFVEHFFIHFLHYTSSHQIQSNNLTTILFPFFWSIFSKQSYNLITVFCICAVTSQNIKLGKILFYFFLNQDLIWTEYQSWSDILTLTICQILHSSYLKKTLKSLKEKVSEQSRLFIQWKSCKEEFSFTLSWPFQHYLYQRACIQVLSPGKY